MTTALDRLAERLGIECRYFQVDGTERLAPPETKRALIAAMGFDVGDERQAGEALAQLKTQDAGTLAPYLLVRAGEPSTQSLPSWRLCLEDGSVLTSDHDAPGHLPPLPMGVHLLQTEDCEVLVVASPPKAPSFRDLSGRERGWGVTAALYGLRSERNLGLGDYEDLARLSEILGHAGADFLGINPIHALGTAEQGASPYSPSSRTGFDTAHIALDTIPELAACPEARAILSQQALAIEVARETPLVLRQVRRQAGEAALRALFAAFEQTKGARHEAFAAWLSTRPAEARLQSLYEALSLTHGGDWRHWPAGLRSTPDHPDLLEYQRAHTSEIRYHDWLQWTAETQIAAAQTRARQAGMALGLYLDIAVGVRPGGAETWAARNDGIFAQGCSLGAPPDLLNSEGQRWNLAPFSPLGLARTRYRAFRTMLATAMARAGVVRIDHIIGFQRSFWVPDDGAPSGYVRFPLDLLLALTRIEAHRAGCLVIGEDLGTVPEGLRETLAHSGILGCAILPFERQHDGYTHPGDYRPQTLAAFATHDLPTLAGWWRGRDIEIRTALGHLQGAPIQWAWDERRWLRTRLCHLLASAGLLPEGLNPDAPPETLDTRLRDGLHGLLGRASSELVALQLDDIYSEGEQQNVPGTVEEYPNWCRRTALSLER
ncbi:MAG: 4-alpha-glucanotransferase, partial [Pseudomonadota bacterium]